MWWSPLVYTLFICPSLHQVEEKPSMFFIPLSLNKILFSSFSILLLKFKPKGLLFAYHTNNTAYSANLHNQQTKKFQQYGSQPLFLSASVGEIWFYGINQFKESILSNIKLRTATRHHFCSVPYEDLYEYSLLLQTFLFLVKTNIPLQVLFEQKGLIKH